MQANNTKTVLVIDDDADLGALLTDYLKRFSFTTITHTDPRAGIAAARTGTANVIILDVMMPGMDGLEVCKRIREFSAVPILMLTARGDTSDKVLGLEIGADDYLPKPFEPRELVARIQALTRRAQGQIDNIEAGGITFSKRAGKAYRTVAGQQVDLGLSDTEFAILQLLVKHRPDPVSRDKLFSLMRGFERGLTDRSIDILISRLRHKLNDDPNSPRYIRTVRLVGYCYIA